MSRTRRILNVFLASPSDVIVERALAEEVVATVNKLTRRHLGWQIDLHKWEDTTPGFGRPQEIINQMVDECDIFVGLLWERWGQPSGKYSSGFEEEFERARARRKADNKPEIMLVFKDIDPSKLGDPGVQLAQVIAFRNSQLALKEVLFTTVRDSEDWKAKLLYWLLDVSMKLGSQGTGEEQIGVVPSFESPDTNAIESASELGHRPNTPQQLKNVSALLDETLHSGKLEFSSTDRNKLREFDVVRLFLLSATLMSHRYTSEVFGTHETNLLYKHREELDLTATEEYQLLRTFIADRGDVQPGWFWFKEMQEESIGHALLTLATRDSSEYVRSRTLDLLAAAHIKIPIDFWPFLPFGHDSLVVQSSAFHYLGTMGDETALPILDALMDDDNLLRNTNIRDAKVQILTRSDPVKLLSETIAKDEYLSDSQLQSLTSHAAELDEQT
jgi:hypothetical protein